MPRLSPLVLSDYSVAADALVRQEPADDGKDKDDDDHDGNNDGYSE
jgi:hypothetical protein